MYGGREMCIFFIIIIIIIISIIITDIYCMVARVCFVTGKTQGFN